MDEIIYVDWGTENGKVSLLERVKHLLPSLEKISEILISPEEVTQLTPPDSENMSSNSAEFRIRRASGEYIISTNMDIIAPSRDELDALVNNGLIIYTVARKDIDSNLAYDLINGNNVTISELRNLLSDIVKQKIIFAMLTLNWHFIIQ